MGEKSIQMLQSLHEGVCWRYVEGDGEYVAEPVRSKISNLRRMTLREFCEEYQEDMSEYYGEEFWTHRDEIITDCDMGDTVILCLVDDREVNLNSVPDHQKKKIRKSGKWRRDKIRHKWAYVNPMNRIHGYIVLKDLTNQKHETSILSISAICSTYFTDKKGIGADLMELAKDWGKNERFGYHDIVLEVANEYSGMGFDEESEEEESEEEYSSEESEDEESEEESEEEEEFPWIPCESALDILSSELWRKCMRKDWRGNPTYNLDQAYIEEAISDYMNCEKNSEDDKYIWSGTSKREVNKNEPGENEYGGFWYRKGKKSQERLMKFYEMHGYKEDPDVHLSWCCFSEIPYPTMRLQLK